MWEEDSDNWILLEQSNKEVQQIYNRFEESREVIGFIVLFSNVGVCFLSVRKKKRMDTILIPNWLT